MKTIKTIDVKSIALPARKRVASYARVSMESDRQAHSLSTQISYYNDLIQKEKVKHRKFCSNECRVTWWNSHPEQVNRRNPRTGKCLCCGKEFTWYGPKPHKFCCHECYIKHRYEGVTHDTEAV